MTHEQEIKDLRDALLSTVTAMKRSEREGCTDHLDCCEDGGKFWYDALEDAKKALNRSFK